MDVRFITFMDHGSYSVDPGDCPCCPVCDQPMWDNEPLAIQTVHNDYGPDLVRLTHTDCILEDDDDDEEGDEGDEGGDD